MVIYQLQRFSLMSDKKKTSDQYLFSALKRNGLIVPKKEEDVEAFEEMISSLDIPPIPGHLNDPLDFIDQAYTRPRKVLSKHMTQESLNLARAAREGKMIPPSVLQKMRKDRDNAQKED